MNRHQHPSIRALPCGTDSKAQPCVQLLQQAGPCWNLVADCGPPTLALLNSGSNSPAGPSPMCCVVYVSESCQHDSEL